MRTLLSILILAASCFGADKKFGWKPSPHGVKAPTLAFRAEPLPPTASVAQWFFPTNQGDRGACVAFTAYECASAVHSRDYGSRWKLSPLDIYQQCLVRDGSFPQDAGTYGTTAINVLKLPGAMTESLWPYSKPLTVLPVMTPARKGSRTKHQALVVYAIPNDDNGYAAKRCIATLKTAVMAGSYWYGNGMTARKAQCSTLDARGSTAVVTRYILPMPSGRPVGGHEVPFIEYDDNMRFPDGNVGGVRIHNHWEDAPGDVWGDEIGSAWIPYRWAFNPRYVEDLCVIQSVKK